MLTSQKKIKKDTFFKLLGLPDEWPKSLTDDIQHQLAADGGKVVVLDDDPTGTQTVHALPVLTEWSVDSLVDELRGPHKGFYLLTNSRSMPVEQACRLSHEIGRNLDEAAEISATPVTVISRSDSTLRGHFPAEVDAIAEAMKMEALPYVLIPCFFEGGRYTVNDVHYATEDDMLVPVAQTSYAKDTVFGFKHSNLRRWVQEKTSRRISQDHVVSLSIDDIRIGGPVRVYEILTGLTEGMACVVNAVSYRDLEVFVLGLLKAQSGGARFLFRTAASFVRVRCGVMPRELLQADDIVTQNRNGGLFVVGSYVPKTTRQVYTLMKQEGLTAIKVETSRLLEDKEMTEEINWVIRAMNHSIGNGHDVLLYTSRELITGKVADEDLEISRRISNSIIDIVKGLQYQPRYLVAKGGITSSDVATKSLGVHRAIVLGQILPGVPVWQLGAETRFPSMPYIVFPGNVGEDGALADIKKELSID